MTKYDDDTVNSVSKLYDAVWNDDHQNNIMIFNGKTGLLTLLVLDSYLRFENFCQDSGVNNNNNNNPFLLSLHSNIVSCV